MFEQLKRGRRIILLLTILLVSVAITASYTLGPDTYTASVDEYNAVKYVWKIEMAERLTQSQYLSPDLYSENGFCVVGDTYPLLVLEAVSGGRIAGGGFPMDEYFSQPERIASFQNLSKNAGRLEWLSAMRATKSSHCWLVVNQKDFKPNSFFDSEGSDVHGFGDVLVWRYKK